MSGRFSLTAQLNRLTNFLLVLALLATGCGMALIVRQAHEVSASLQLTLAQLPVYSQALRLVEAISAERGPTNAMLGEREGDPQALAGARTLSDERFNQLLQALQGCPECSVTVAQVKTGYQSLHQARALVDERLSASPSDPGRPAVAQVVLAMFQAADASFRSGDITLQDLATRTPGIAACLVNAKLASRLRDTAGRLGSLLTPALQAARAPTADEREQLQQTQGRLHQLADLLRGNLEGSAAEAERERFQQLRERYLGEGLAYYQQTLTALLAGQPPSAAAFARGYVPTMASILDLRDTALSLAEAEAARLAREAHLCLLLTIVAALGILLALGTGLLLLKRRLLSPLLANTQRLLTLTRRHMPASTIADDEDDPRTLFAAFEQLERELQQADLLRQERDALIAELGIRAETDHLTGLANRRAFERQLAQGVVDTPNHLAAITFDIDHFKRINDTYGHGAGDLLLQHLAQRCNGLLREGERIARIGGEEFAVLADVKQASEALALAERLRRGIAETPFAVGPTEALTVTASFGVAVTARAEPGARIRLLAEADAALYRAKHRGRNCSDIAESG
ncbi:GGDEF domain-containing protein [Pseudomonas oryzihabitans]|uniref:GGDEF domain-containing protein n=1 Tax=Pseudomonas oryzihabitans TaxID=47885 RepID=UPI0028952C24|nr:GGDEF domain-containing protein [Pseudomonas oryzihabitans]MDT3722145.1 GGDEF domain-containing protein [Pseudomonas oryzihabitans]